MGGIDKTYAARYASLYLIRKFFGKMGLSLENFNSCSSGLVNCSAL